MRYQGLAQDSTRWDGFVFRPDDIVISTPPKCGTTWTQMICALLVFQSPVLAQPLAAISPWLDKVDRTRRDVLDDLGAQPHRRFIKTHTPLDGLPLDPRITYICVGRDPRDVALSMDNHISNMDMEAFLAAREAAVGLDGVDGQLAQTRPPRPPTLIERFWVWVDNPSPPNESPSSLVRTLHHLETFWNAPPALDVVMLHYDDLQADLESQMRALADRLSIAVPEGLWPELVAAASFEAMRSRADDTAPGGERGLWLDNDQFFHCGVSGQWRELLGPDDLRRYHARVDPLISPDLKAWVHHDRP